jgi:ABC-2 type transport system permease protein
VLVRGQFTSFFKDKRPPTAEGETPAAVIERSPANARLVVVGSTAFVNDLILNLSRQAPTNLQLVQNLVDWGVEDVDLLSIRSRGTFARTLRPMEEKARGVYELANYAGVTVSLLALVAFTWGRRRRMAPIALDPAAPEAPPTRPAEV